MTFPRFAELPLELQDHVWESCIPNSPPVAHFAKIQRKGFKMFMRSIDGDVYTPLQDQQTSSLKRSWVPTIDAGPYPNLDRPTALRTLLQTTSRSRGIASRHPDALDPVDSVLLAKSDVPNSEEYGASKPALRVNTTTDLVILEEDWNTDLFVNFDRLGFMGLQCPEPLHYLAIPNSKGGAAIGACGLLLSMYCQIRVLYILLEPDELRDSEQPWEDNQDIFLEMFIAAYTAGRIRPGPFRCGQREYFEIPAQQIRSLGGLADLIDKLETSRASRALGDWRDPDGMDGMEPVRFRLMTWRDV